MSHVYSIKGQVTHNQADNEDGFGTVNIDETVDIDVKSTSDAYDKFFTEHPEYDFFGALQTCDAETHGGIGATYRDQNEDQTVDIELIED